MTRAAQRLVRRPAPPRPAARARPGSRRGRSAAGRKPRSPPPPYLADEALALLLAEYEFSTVLDVGCGDGAHAREFRRHGKQVSTVSLEPYAGFEPDFVGDICDVEPARRFDVIWCSHVLEHQRNVGLFLERVLALAKPEGMLAITVPPARREIVGGHLTVWNTGLLLYNLVVAGIDCSRARTREYGYNVSVIVRLLRIELPPLRRDAGDIERLARFFPLPVQQRFDGRIAQIAWSDRRKAPRPAHGASARLSPAQFPPPAPGCRSDLETLRSLAAALHAPGHVLEFGVYRGRSIRALAAALPERTVHGFDSFAGLPNAWKRSGKSVYAAGHFALAAPPVLPGNVRLWAGWFENTLPDWLQVHPGPVALLHIDCDVYQSAATVLQHLDARIVAGTIIVFDELCDWSGSGVYPHWRHGEWKALHEWLARGGRLVRAVTRGPQFAGAVKVIN